MKIQLKDFISRRGKALQEIFQWLCKNDMEEVFFRYLSEASQRVLEKFFNEMKHVDRKRLLQHRKVLAEYFKGEGEVKYSLSDLKQLMLEEPEEDTTEYGMRSLQKGEWASAALAGGAGTRFFSQIERDSGVAYQFKAKGLLPITPVAGYCFLEIFASEILQTAIEAERVPFWLIMTTHITWEEIKEWLKKSPLWGFPKDSIIVFRQEEHPRVDHDGIPLVDEKGALQWTGDGHGGIFRAILRRKENEPSIIEKLKNAGVHYLVIHNVDNPLARPLEPRRLGFHIKGGYLFTMSCIRRTNPQEKMGFAAISKKTNRLEVVEYSVCEPEVLSAEDSSTGRLMHEAGHINTNIVSLKAATTDIEPTLYTSKPVTIQGKAVNSSSFEVLNQHIIKGLPVEKIGAYKVERNDFFSPTKTVKGIAGMDATIKNLSDFYGRRLEELGATIVKSNLEEPLVEIHPCLGLRKENIAQTGVGKNWRVEPHSKLYLGACYGIDRRKPYAEGLVLEKGASFILKAEKPYGDIKYNSKTRSIKPDPSSASKVCIGKNIKIIKGVSVSIGIKGNGTLEIPDNTVLSSSQHLTVGEGEHRILTP